MIDKNFLKEQACAIGIALSEEQLDKLDRYAQFLVEYNQNVNLTAITAPEDIVIKHFVDSMTILANISLPQGASVADIGSGAGFPGAVLGVARPDLKLTLMDSLGKRVTFLTQLIEMLGLSGEAVHIRAEDAGCDKRYREQFDLVTSRAVASMRELAEYSLPLARVGGTFLPMKGPDCAGELEEAKKAIKVLGGTLERVLPLVLAKENKRTLIFIRKSSQTPPVYPRKQAKITSKPLI